MVYIFYCLPIRIFYVALSVDILNSLQLLTEKKYHPLSMILSNMQYSQINLHNTTVITFQHQCIYKITLFRNGESAVSLFLNGSGVLRNFAEYLARMSVLGLYPDF